ncbi:MAG: hypothetical protein ACKVKR_02465, partial [Pseudomonadales bacterium]
MTILKQILPALFTSSGFLFAFVLLPNLTLAQPDVHTDKIVFEPSLIPDSEEEAKVLYSFNNSGGQTVQLAPNQAVSPAERLIIGEAINAYVDALGDMESTDGPFSNNLTEDLF